MADRKVRRPAKRVRRRRTPVGRPPGTLEADADAPPPVIRLIAFGPDEVVEREAADLESVREARGRWPVLWVDVDGLGDAALIAEIGRLFDLHPLALEDVLHVHQRPKHDEYGRCHFVVGRMLTPGERLDTEQVSLFFGRDFVVTFQERAGDCWEPVRERIRKAQGRVRSAGADYLAYALLDAIVDAYFPVLEEFGERLEALEDRVVARPDRSAIGEIHSARRDLLTLRRAVWPLRDALNSLQRDVHLVTDETRVYLRDCYDHTVRIIDVIETGREIAAGLMEVYLSSLSNRMNEIMKVLTIIATIFIPLGFVAGIYGMNFNPEISPWNMPELNWRWGYPFALGLMAVVAGVLLAYCWRKGWFRSSW